MKTASPGFSRFFPCIVAVLTTVACPAFSEDIKALIRKAESGDPESQYMLGNAYYCGGTLQQNHSEAVKWYRRAAEQGDPDAPAMLAIAYEKGYGVPRDDSLAYVWFSIAASRRKGDSYANYSRWRDDAGKRLTPDQLVKAQQMARELEAKRPRQ